MSQVEHLLGAAVGWNNGRLDARADDAGAPNPRPREASGWRRDLEARHPAIRAEWEASSASGRRLPRMEQLIGEHQGNEGAWRAGLLVHAGRPAPPLADSFPETVAALRAVPGLQFALWSVFDPGTELPEHCGPNGGVLRLHLGVDCPPDTALRVGDEVVPYRDGETILFDDTRPHAAWNRSDRQRVTLFCEIRRPAGGLVDVTDRLVQAALGTNPRYRSAPRRALEWERALNP